MYTTNYPHYVAVQWKHNATQTYTSILTDFFRHVNSIPSTDCVFRIELNIGMWMIVTDVGVQVVVVGCLTWLYGVNSAL